jgi:oligopeptide transport system substrate-binding protein
LSEVVGILNLRELKQMKNSVPFRAMVLIGVALVIPMSISGCTSRLKKEPINTLHLATSAKIKGLDPALADDTYAGNEVGRVYEGLLQYHYLKRPYVLIPGLAESMPEVSADGKTFTFKLKKGVLFQDDPCFKEMGGQGREMTAEDVVYSFKRLADPKLMSSGWWIFDGKIVGLNEWREEASKAGQSDYVKVVEGLRAVDRYIVKIKLTQRSAQFLYTLAMPFTGVVPHEAIEHYGKEFLNHPVGTGAYKLAEYNPASKLVWVKNPTYRKELYPSEGGPGDKEAGLLEDAGKPLPLSDKLVVQVFVEQQPQWLNFLAGKLDTTSIPKDSFRQAITPAKNISPELKEKGIRLVTAPGLDITHESFNMMDPVMGKNRLLRQAMSMSIDQDTFNEIFYNGRAILAQGPIPPGIDGYDPDFKNPYRQFNVAKAKELLAKAGYPEGRGLPPLEYATIADSTSRQISEFLQKSYAAIGVQLKVNAYSWPEFQSAVKNRRGQMWGFAWSADYPDAENFLQLFYSKNASPGPNDSNYSNPEFDKLYENALTLQSGAERTALYKKMVHIIVEDCPWIFGAHRISYGLIQPWLKNYKVHDFDHSRAKYYRVDPSLKK